jgi:hypothetical protein
MPPIVVEPAGPIVFLSIELLALCSPVPRSPVGDAPTLIVLPSPTGAPNIPVQ